jgi:hypothetical protein
MPLVARPSGHTTPQKQQSRPKAALCRRPSIFYRQRAASAGTIPVAIAAKLVGVALVDVTGSPPFKVDGTLSVAQRGRAVNRRDVSQGPGAGGRGVRAQLRRNPTGHSRACRASRKMRSGRLVGEASPKNAAWKCACPCPTTIASGPSGPKPSMAYCRIGRPSAWRSAPSGRRRPRKCRTAWQRACRPWRRCFRMSSVESAPSARAVTRRRSGSIVQLSGIKPLRMPAY